MSIFLISPVFAEPMDVEIDWTIEGQQKTNLTSEFVEDTEEIIKKNHDDNLPIPYSEPEIYEDYVSGNGYTIGDRIITIDSEEGQILNQILIEQKKINRDNFLHMIKYLDRYSDGYICEVQLPSDDFVVAWRR